MQIVTVATSSEKDAAEWSSSPYTEEHPLQQTHIHHRVGVHHSQKSKVTPTRDGESPPNAKHWYERVLDDPNEYLESQPSEVRFQMVRYRNIATQNKNPMD
jgi:hypothetical protein